ncbi:LacI family DNA-binding transcriptional regulator [Agromyces archimandritae]|uniref:LacI family DNA-binding transcriptional regulator n=1 Tax=Agromyces archimandritae TaxID=2781962 RepID=A0A975FN21_9MICO|nr:LacI family DNA-binding transcriptional regulator [Agromyces archimandritae]QTX05170.1 LacI family DNA-binding transcriptional regulator [Agromyces archimandritae]
MNEPRVRIRDVARAAGVSTATVSYVLNEAPGQTIRPETRERVRRAAAELGYAPHGIARSLREGRSRIVVLNTGVFAGGGRVAELVAGMDAELREHGFTLLLTSAAGGVPAEVVDAVAPRAVLDLADFAVGDERADDVSGFVAGDHVGFAYQSYAQLQHLAERGHRAIALAVPAGRAAAGPALPARIEHARRAAARLGIPEPVLLELDLDGPRDARRDALGGLLDRSPVTAVAGYSDDEALAVIVAAAELGIEVPARLAVMGFDERGYGGLIRPALTTLRIDAAAYGRRAARIALGLDPGEWTGAPSSVVEREST